MGGSNMYFYEIEYHDTTKYVTGYELRKTLAQIKSQVQADLIVDTIERLGQFRSKELTVKRKVRY